MSRPTDSAHGFTLLEMLISIVVMALVLTIAGQIFRDTHRAYEQTSPERNRDLEAELFLDRLERELVGTILVEKPAGSDRLLFPWVFVAEDRVFGTEDSDALRFITQTPARVPGRPSAGIRSVIYAVAPAEGEDEDVERMDLLRQESALPGALNKSVAIDDGLTALEDIHRFELRFRDERSGAWLERWDSTDVAMLDALPEAVEVTVSLYEENGAGEIEPGSERARVIELPVRPFSPTADEEEGGAGCADGPSVDECLDLYQEAIASRNDAEQESLYAAASAAPEGCWLDPDPPAELRALHRAFEDVLGVSPEEACE